MSIIGTRCSWRDVVRCEKVEDENPFPVYSRTKTRRIVYRKGRRLFPACGRPLSCLNLNQRRTEVPRAPTDAIEVVQSKRRGQRPSEKANKDWHIHCRCPRDPASGETQLDRLGSLRRGVDEVGVRFLDEVLNHGGHGADGRSRGSHCGLVFGVRKKE